ncbi:MAG: hypothetical protein CMN55_12360 [Sneathiella sp.]|uniref:hypothetical protein n=1 Tax=Sneathiella sp. TaxID=1964365 RepID=UPI000C5E9D2F|nr:hypothetical protein [Sneathiella sp.]MAL79883.1 hypothetical protein [Sneathiella sp.]|tara:strand:- start:232 stop:897 length:666 start_codon:yes stop_codon:yes gene_type:complete
MIASESPSMMEVTVRRLQRLQQAARAAYQRHVQGSQAEMTAWRARFCENFLPSELATLKAMHERDEERKGTEMADTLDIPPVPPPHKAEKAEDDAPPRPRRRKALRKNRPRPRLTLYGVSPPSPPASTGSEDAPSGAAPETEAETEDTLDAEIEQRLLDEIDQVAKILHAREEIKATAKAAEPPAQAPTEAPNPPETPQDKATQKKGRFLKNLFDVKPRFR